MQSLENNNKYKLHRERLLKLDQINENDLETFIKSEENLNKGGLSQDSTDSLIIRLPLKTE